MEYTEEHKSSRKEISSLHFEALSWGKHFIPKPELRATAYCFLPMGPRIDFPLLMNYSDTDTGNREPYFYFLNGHGDVTYFADQNFTEEQIETYEYTPWGVLLTSASKNNLLYTAREFDFETGLQFNRNRYHNPYFARFNQKDNKFSAKNKFLYVYNRPVELKDPWGLYGTPIPGMIPGPVSGPLQGIADCLRGLCEDCGGCWKESGSFWHCDQCPGQSNWEYLLVMACYEYLAWICVPTGPFF